MPPPHIPLPPSFTLLPTARSRLTDTHTTRLAYAPGDEESVHGAEGDESSEDKRNSGREEGAKEESENEDDENNKKKPSATKKPKKEKKEKKERKRDKLGNLLSWRSDDHKRPTYALAPFTPVEPTVLTVAQCCCATPWELQWQTAAGRHQGEGGAGL